MKIATALVGNSSTKFSSRVMKLVFKISSTHADTDALLAALLASKVELTSTHPSYATKTRLYKNSLSDLLEIAACNEGAIRINGAGGAYILRGSIELSDDGSIIPLENEQFQLTLELAANLTADVYALDVNRKALTEIQYKPVPSFGGSPTPVNVLSARWLGIPKTKLTKVEFENLNGTRIEYLPEELEQILSEANEQSLIINGAVTPGSLNLYIMNVSEFKTAHITTSEQVNVYVVNESASL